MSPSKLFWTFVVIGGACIIAGWSRTKEPAPRLDKCLSVAWIASVVGAFASLVWGIWQ